jgi:hypothetical protein
MGAVGALVAAPAWGLTAVFVLAMRAERSCEDYGACASAAPLFAWGQTALAAAGIVAALLAALLALVFTVAGQRGKEAARAGAISTALLAVWLVVVFVLGPLS